MGGDCVSPLDTNAMINNNDAFLSGVWNYDFINERLPGKRAVSDIDGSLERKGNFLFIETKATGAGIPTGQLILYEQLVCTGVANVLFVYGDTDCPIYYQKMKKKGNKAVLGEKKSIDAERLASMVRSWYDWANGKPTENYTKSRV